MQIVSIQKAADLPPNVKSAVEQLLGRPIGADEEVSVVAVPPGQMPPSEPRARVAQQLENLLNRRAAKVGDTSDEEIDAAIDETVDRVRHRRE
ncbi:MAG: hypothetical protein ABSH24_04925 [Bryobacteraceae bacterium]|jgi:hypothetical protein